MSHIRENIKTIRKHLGDTQQSFADKIEVKRPVIGAYEEGRAEPKISTLQKIATLVRISIDTIYNKDLSKFSPQEWNNSNVDIEGKKLRVLTVSLDDSDNESINLVPQKASAGYLNGFSDPEFIEELPKIQLPHLKHGTFRGFEIKGDSMLPLQSGTIIVGKYIDDWHDIKDNKTYIIISETEGTVYKRVINNINNDNYITLISDNTTYEPYDISINNIIEAWEAVTYISSEFPTPTKKDNSQQDVMQLILNMQQEIASLKK